MFLKFYYYPMYKYLEAKYREGKSRQVEKLVIQTNKVNLSACRNSLKLRI
jgi:hypothetical protein